MQQSKKWKKNHQIFFISQKSSKFAENHKTVASVCEKFVAL
jgi:uncharacterized protein YhfF